MMWTQGFVELFRWRRQRRALEAQGAKLVSEAEKWLAAQTPARPPSEPPRPTEPPRLG